MNHQLPPPTENNLWYYHAISALSLKLVLMKITAILSVTMTININIIINTTQR
jgi:hypothetical protein